MVDVFTKQKRSQVMSRIRGRDTVPERGVRSLLHRLGYRFSLRAATLPGRPDLVLPAYSTVIFVHGCFWHRHTGCQFAYTPKTRPEFWLSKLTGNASRDRKVRRQLRALGWSVITVWECDLRTPATLARRLDRELRKRKPSQATRPARMPKKTTSL
jgi:DNA mismatch endonuclease, patch repair protein